MAHKIPEKIQYVAVVTGVHEVTLVANADLEYWKEKLKDEEVKVYDDQGKAELMISSADLVWKGMRSQEVSVSIKVCDNDRNEPNGFYLIHAFNSSRLFAWIERKVFHTPYYYGRIEVSAEHPVSVIVGEKGHTWMMLHIPESRFPVMSENRQWNGPIFLPSLGGSRKDHGRLFYAKIGGATEVHSFQPSVDLIRIQESIHHPVLRMLLDSNVTGKEWHIRKEAAHAKSKTYLRKA